MLRKFTTSLCAVAVLLLGGVAQADNQKPTVTFNKLSVKNFVSGRGIKIDQAFGDKHGLSVDAPFRFIVPIDKKKFRVGGKPAPKPGNAFMKITFATLAEPVQFMENIQFTRLRIAQNNSQTGAVYSLEQRLKLAAQVLSKQGFAAVTRGRQQAKLLKIRRIKVGKLDAAEVIGSYMDDKNGQIFTRLVGIINPESDHGIASISNVAVRFFKIKGPDDFVGGTQSGRLLTTFKFIK